MQRLTLTPGSSLQDHSSVCHQNNYPRKSSNNVPVFKFVTWKFLSLSATALIGLSLTGVVPWAAPQ